MKNEDNYFTNGHQETMDIIKRGNKMFSMEAELVSKENKPNMDQKIKDLDKEIRTCEELREPKGYYTPRNAELFDNQITMMTALKEIMEKINRVSCP